MHVTSGRMLLMLQINPEALGRGRNLDRTSSQDSTRCESCLATEHEILSAGRWFITLLLQLRENRKIETLRKRNGYSSIFPEHFPELDFFFPLMHWHGNVEECRNENVGEPSSSGWQFGAMVHADAVICMSVQNQFRAHFRDIHTIWLSSHITAVANSRRATDFFQDYSSYISKKILLIDTSEWGFCEWIQIDCSWTENVAFGSTDVFVCLSVKGTFQAFLTSPHLSKSLMCTFSWTVLTGY